MKNKIRLSIVGTGYFSQFHFDAWKRLDVEVVGICSLNKHEALERSKQFNNCKVFEDFKNIREHHDIGFMMFPAYGKGFEIGNKKEYKDILLTSAASLASRFNPNVGTIMWTS